MTPFPAPFTPFALPSGGSKNRGERRRGQSKEDDMSTTYKRYIDVDDLVPQDSPDGLLDLDSYSAVRDEMTRIAMVAARALLVSNTTQQSAANTPRT